MAGKIQNEDIKSSAELAGAGGTDAQLPNDTKIYVTGNSLNKKLSDAVAAGDLVRSIRTINAQSGTTYTFVLSDGSKNGNSPLVTANNASPQTYTVPPNSGVAFPIGTQIDVIQMGSGKVTFAPGSGVTIDSKGSNLSISAQFVGVTLIKVAVNEWVLIGDLVA